MRLSLHVYRELIQNCPFFQPLSSAAIVQLVRELRPRIFCPRAVIYPEGQAMNSLYLIRRGVIRVWVNFERPAERMLLATLGPNDFFGETALQAEGEPPLATTTTECVSFCELLALSREQCKEVLERVRRQSTQVLSPPTHGGAAGDTTGEDSRSVSKQLADEQRMLGALRKLRRGSTALRTRHLSQHGAHLAAEHLRVQEEMKQAIEEASRSSGNGGVAGNDFFTRSAQYTRFDQQSEQHSEHHHQENAARSRRRRSL